jgi:two-component system OmpR family response regulator
MAQRQSDVLMLDELLAESVVQQLRELVARLEALLRPTAPHETILRVGPLELDLLTRVVHRGHRELELLPREFKLLEYMMHHAGQVLTRAMLLQRVWHYRFEPHSNLVDVHIGRLRRKLDGPGDTPMILSVRGVGFILHAPA